MNTKKAAADLGCSESFLDKAAANQTGPAYRWIGHRREYDQRTSMLTSARRASSRAAFVRGHLTSVWAAVENVT